MLLNILYFIATIVGTLIVKYSDEHVIVIFLKKSTNNVLTILFDMYLIRDLFQYNTIANI
jgi:hypothetical protein